VEAQAQRSIFKTLDRREIRRTGANEREGMLCVERLKLEGGGDEGERTLRRNSCTSRHVGRCVACLDG